MTQETLLTSEYFASVKTAAEGNARELIAEFTDKVCGVGYKRVETLESILPGITIRPVPTKNDVGSEDIAYSIWLIGELQGRLQAQETHKKLATLSPLACNYSYLHHIRLLGALRAELQLLTTMLEMQNQRQARPIAAEVVSRHGGETPRATLKG